MNQAVYRCRERGFLTFEQEGFSNEIRAIYLADEKIEEVERYLEVTYQYESRYSKKQRVEELIAEYENGSSAACRECGKLKQMLEKNRIPQNYLQIKDMLRALVFIENNERELFLREASMLIYGDSKHLREELLYSVCRAFREYLGRPCREDELGQLERIYIHTPNFMTIENRTSWLRMKIPDAALFNLGGYASRFQRDLLKKIYSDNPKLNFWHFGDIDAGGLYIHEHLCRVTEIPFRLYRMSRRELESPNFQTCLKPLTQQDRIWLKSLEKRKGE